VLGRHMRDFMAEHAREFGFGLEQSEQAARHMDDAAWRSKRVYAVGIEDDELPVELRPRTALRQHLSNQRHIPGNVLVLIDAEVLPQFSADFFTEFALIGVG